MTERSARHLQEWPAHALVYGTDRSGGGELRDVLFRHLEQLLAHRVA